MREYTYGELKESKLIYDRKPPAFGVIMTILTLVFVLGAILWAALSTKTYVVKASGIVADEAKVNIMNSVSGKIKKIHVVEGQAVEAGAVLFDVDDYQVRLQISQAQAMVDLYYKRIVASETLINYVNNYLISDTTTHAMPFDQNDAELASFYSNAFTFKNYVDEQVASAEQEGGSYEQSALDGIKGQLLSQLSVYSNLENFIVNKTQHESQLNMYKESLSQYSIKAEKDGVVHLSSGLTTGTVISNGSLLGNISTNENLYFNTIISASDRSKISVGGSVEISVSGVMQSEFGVLKGKIVAIDTDATQTEDGQVFYCVKVVPNETTMKDKKGNVVQLTNGMNGECRIKYDETTWLKWAIEQIGVKFK